MRNAIAVPILWMLISIPLPGQPNPEKKPAETKSSESQRDQRGSKDSPVFVDIEQHPQSETDTAKIEKSTQRKETVDLVTAWAAILAAFFTGLLVVVGYCGVRAAVRTLRAIEKQAHLMQEQNLEAQEANASARTFAHSSIVRLEQQGLLMGHQTDLMKRQADLTEAQFDQWAELDEWKGALFKASKFLISVKLKNSTNFPMKITGQLQISNVVGGIGNGEIFFMGKDSFIPPQNHLLIEVRPALSLEQQAVDSFWLRADGYASHVHRISGRTVIQPFEYDLRCSQTPGTNDWNVQAMALCQMNPEKKTEEGENQPAN